VGETDDLDIAFINCGMQSGYNAKSHIVVRTHKECKIGILSYDTGSSSKFITPRGSTK
jgi:hypothetical protein